MRKIATKMDAEMVAESCAELKKLSIVMMIVGAVGLVFYVLSGVIEVFAKFGFLLDVILWLSAFLLVFGITFFGSGKRLNKQLLNKNLVNVYDFYDDYFMEESLDNGEVVGTVKHFYKDVYKVTQSQNYLFVYINKVNFLPVHVAGITEEDLTYIKSRFEAVGKKIKKHIA